MSMKSTPAPPGLAPLSAPNDLRIVGLMPRARDGRLVLCMGAGASMDAGLPSGAALARAFCDRLSTHGIDLPGVNRDDLVAVSDAAVANGGLLVVQQIVVDVAPFASAVPSLAHRSIALLLLEGVAAILSTNWDTCVERAAPTGEQILAIATNDDRLSVRQKGLLKVHGCASRPDTVLITSAQLNAPPIWADNEFGAHLAASKVVFVGIGDVAGYVTIRVERLISDLGPTKSVAVVTPNIDTAWAKTRWASLLPTLEPEDRFAMTAADFCDALLRAWANDALQIVENSAKDLSVEALTTAVDATVAVIRSHTADRFVRWLRGATPKIEPGRSALYGSAVVEGLCALAFFTQAAVVQAIPESGPLTSDRGRIDLHVAYGGYSGPKAAQSARSRVAFHRSQGFLKPDEPITVICAGQVGPLEPRRATDLAADIVAPTQPGDLIAGPQAGPTELVSASAILEGMEI